MKAILILILILLVSGCSRDKIPTGGTVDVPLISEATVFGLNAPFSTSEDIRFTITKFQDLNVKKVRIWENWGLREPTQGTENWKPLDTKINAAKDNNLSIVLTLKPVGLDSSGNTYWYCDPAKANENSCVFQAQYEQDFKDYISNLTKRYSNKIDKIQFSNEWTSDYHFVGSEQDYVKYANWVYDITKANSPKTEVVLGSMTKWPFVIIAGCQLKTLNEVILDDGTVLSGKTAINQYCKNKLTIVNRTSYVLANAKYDKVDIHFYDDPDNWDEYIAALKTLTSKPIIITEFGGPDIEDPRFDAYDESVQSSELRKYMDKIRTLGVQEAYFFTLVQSSAAGINHPLSGLMKLVNNYPEAKPNYNVFKEYTTGSQQQNSTQNSKKGGFTVIISRLFNITK
ncbi:hypothetical protein J4438_02530 [Candidatus Woesearchaeota archaeon]|nr:hypothetical protein [Candidatus Woesearchaeota archaeon]